jgi:hypothetical protein
MASGTLGQSAPAASTNTTVYTVPALKTATFNVSIANTTGYFVPFRLSISATGTPATSEYIEYNTCINAFDTYERGGLIASAGKNIVVFSEYAGLSVSIYGYEE